MKLKSLFLTCCIFPITAFAGYTAEKGKLDMNFEYVLGQANDSKHVHEFELDAEFGVANNLSFGMNILYSTLKLYDEVVVDGSGRVDFQRYSPYQKFNYNINDENVLGMRNRLQIVYEDGFHYNIFDIKLLYQNTSSVGIYDSFRFDLGFARTFNGSMADALLNEVHLNLSLSENVGFHTRIETLFFVASGNFIDNSGETFINNRRGNIFKFKPADMTLFTGPEYNLGDDKGVIYLHGRIQIGGRIKTHDRALVFGYGKSFF